MKRGTFFSAFEHKTTTGSETQPPVRQSIGYTASDWSVSRGQRLCLTNRVQTGRQSAQALIGQQIGYAGSDWAASRVQRLIGQCGTELLIG